MQRTGTKLEHLERTVAERPEYREVLSPFRSLFAYVEGKEDETGISFLLPGENTPERVAGGIPLLSAERLSLDRAKALSFLAGMLSAVGAASRSTAATEELARIGARIADGSLDLAALFAACMRRDRPPLEEAAAAASVSPALLEFLLEVPLKTALERAAETVEPSSLEGWKEGYCPVCGSRAGMDELVGEEGKRFLCCSACFFRWPFPRLCCPYCGNRDPDTLSYFLADDGPTRVGVCRACSRYIKTRDSRRGNADVPLEVEDLATIHLDLLAGREGFERGR